jgi:GTP cyclohydrolase I
MKTATAIAERIRSAGGSFFANDNIADHLEPGELEALERELVDTMGSVLRGLVIDTENDHNTQDTAKRIAKMYVREVFRGRYQPMPSVTDFPNAKRLDEIYTIGPITVRSGCSHHMVPIMGKAWVGVLPSERVIGISKFIRLVEWIMARPQIQEEATVQVADLIEQLINPKGLAIVVRAQHQCMTWRGVRETDTSMTTSVMRGVFLTNPAARSEFLKLIEGQP